MNNRFLKTLSIRPFLFLWLAEVFSQIGMNMVNFVLIIVAFKLTQSNTAVSGIILSFTIPAVIFGLIAGVIVDRMNKKFVLFTSNISRCILLLVLVFWHTNLPVIYIVSFVVAIVTQFFIPAETPMIPVVVRKDLLLSANALFGIAMYGSILVAYALAGPFLLLFGETYVFAILSCMFLLATLCVSFITVQKKQEESLGILPDIQVSTVVDDIKNAFSVMKKTKEIYNALFLLALSNFIILILAVLGPGYGTHVLKIQVDSFPLLFVTPAAVGMMFGAFFVGNYLQYRSRYKVAALGAMLAGFVIVLLPFASKTPWHIISLLAFFLGVANAFVFVPSNTLLQEKTHPEYRGKVYGALSALVGIFSLVPVVIIGELADTFGVGTVLGYLGLSIGIIGVMHFLFSSPTKGIVWKT